MEGAGKAGGLHRVKSSGKGLHKMATQFRINEREYEMTRRLHQMSRENIKSPMFRQASNSSLAEEEKQPAEAQRPKLPRR